MLKITTVVKLPVKKDTSKNPEEIKAEALNVCVWEGGAKCARPPWRALRAHAATHPAVGTVSGLVWRIWHVACPGRQLLQDPRGAASSLGSAEDTCLQPHEGS